MLDELRKRLMSSLGLGGDAPALDLLRLDEREKGFRAERGALVVRLADLERDRTEVLRQTALGLDGVDPGRADSLLIDIAEVKQRIADIDAQLLFLEPEKKRLLHEIALAKAAEYDGELQRLEADLQDRADAVLAQWGVFCGLLEGYKDANGNFGRIHSDCVDLCKARGLSYPNQKAPLQLGFLRWMELCGGVSVTTLHLPVSRLCRQRPGPIIPPGLIGKS